jgi:sodium/bile acid cotransporter 7
MGVTLHADTIRRSLARPLPALLAIGMNVVAVPLLCLPTWWLLSEQHFGGLFITAIVPCTLASASVWTRKAEGDDSIAMMTTVVTNLACVVVVPLGIWLVLSQQTEIDAVQQVSTLAMLVVLPLILAQAMRRAGLDAWADRHKFRLAALAQVGILLMVIFGAQASATLVDRAASPSAGWIRLLWLIVTAAVIHVLALLLGVVGARMLGMTRASQIAVGIAGSQKTLMVGLQIAIECGVSVIPMLVYHLSQLFIDTIVAEHWRRRSSDPPQP